MAQSPINTPQVLGSYVARAPGVQSTSGTEHFRRVCFMFNIDTWDISWTTANVTRRKLTKHMIERYKKKNNEHVLRII